MKKEDKSGIVIIFVLIAILGVLIYHLVYLVKEEERLFIFAKNNELHESNNCWLDNDICKCEYEGLNIEVDYYYEED